MAQKKNHLETIFRNRLTRIRRILVRKKIDALVLTTHEDHNRNVLWASGFGGTMAIVIVTKREAFIGVDSRYVERAKMESPHLAIIELKPRERFSDIIAKILKRIPGRGKRKIGYEGHHISVLAAKAWQKRIPGKLIPLEDEVGRLRQYKDEYEIREITKACRAATRTLEEITKRIKPGMRENDIAADIDATLRIHGAASSSFETIVASGPNAAIPHHNTGARKIKPGEPVVMDFGARFPSGYCSDITRTIFVPGTQPSPEMKKIYDIVLAANRAAFRAVRAGMTWKTYDSVARSYISERGYDSHFTHSLGHSLGLAVHDPFDYQDDRIRVGTVFTNEPGIYLPGKGGVRIEDDVVMTQKGPIRLTNASYLIE